jgi:hypothetical protein
MDTGTGKVPERRRGKIRPLSLIGTVAVKK